MWADFLKIQTHFSHKHHRLQVEYAMEAISHAGTAIGIVSKDGVVMAAEKKIVSKLLDNVDMEKMYRIDEHISCVVAGITADANTLVNYTRLAAQRYKYSYGEPMPVENLVKQVCNVKQSYTQYGGMRPYGVSFLYAGYDEHFGYQLYHSDPSGNYGGWKATAIGANNQAAQDILKTDWKEDLSLMDALMLAVKVMGKTMDSTSLTPEKLEFSSITRDDNGKVSYHTLKHEEVERLIKRGSKDLKKGEETSTA